MWKFLSLLVVFTLITACKNEGNKADPATQDQPMEFNEQMMQQDMQNPPEAVSIPAGADGIVHHYICTDLCKGGHSESAGTCPVCGKALAHNQAWHDQQQPPSETPTIQQNPTIQSGPTQQNLQMQQQAQPQDAGTVNIPAGADGIVHHYICAAGCKGGNSPNAGNCPVCGKALAHNQAFHNQ